MSVRLSELCELLGGELVGEGSVEITGISEIESAECFFRGFTDFFLLPGYLPVLLCKPGCTPGETTLIPFILKAIELGP